jgi:hypothetical protein
MGEVREPRRSGYRLIRQSQALLAVVRVHADLGAHRRALLVDVVRAVARERQRRGLGWVR